MLIFDIFLLVKEPLVAAFSETHTVTSWNNIVKQGMKISTAWDVSFWGVFLPCFSHTTLVVFSEYLPQKILISGELNFLKKTFVTTSSEVCALRPRICFAEGDKNVRKWLEKRINLAALLYSHL